MEDEASTSLDGKGLGNLRVVDLKQELEKRGLSKSGSKKDLVKRLKQQLEFEKLCGERKSGDFDRKLELDAAIEQNEFVKQYLAEQQKRLESQALQKHDDENEADSTENEATIVKKLDSDSDEAVEESSETDEPSQNDEPTRNKNVANMPVAEALGSNEKCSSSSETEDKPNDPSSPTVSENVIIQPKILEFDQSNEAERNQNNTQSLVSVTENEDKIKKVSQSSLPESGEKNTNDSEDALEKQKYSCDDISVSSTSDNIKEQTDNTNHEDINHSEDKTSEILYQDSCDAMDNGERSSNVAHSSVNTEQTDYVRSHSDILNTSVENTKRVSQVHTSLEESSSPENLCKQDSMANMESPKSSSVPYSLSDIQLPESPGHHLKSKDLNNENCIKTDSISGIAADQNSTSDSQIQSNGVSTVDNANSNEEQVSEYETKKNDDSTVTSEKSRQRKESEDSRQTDESSDVECDKDDSKNKKSIKLEVSSPEREDRKSKKSLKVEDSSPEKDDSKNKKFIKLKVSSPEKDDSKNKKSLKVEDSSPEKDDGKNKKPLKFEDPPSKIMLDAKEENASKESKEHKPSKHRHQSCESDKSSDSDKYKHRRLDSKHKSRVKHRKRNRRSRSQSSTTSSSHSSDSSSKQRHSKISVVTVKCEIDYENIHPSNKSLEEKTEEQKKEDSFKEYPEYPLVPSVSSKKRFKIKRDNVALEVDKLNIESNVLQIKLKSESTSSKIHTSSSDLHSVPDRPLKQEHTEIKLSLSDLPYVPRKVSLSNRKLNRKSSEDKNNEPKSKKSKWASFAAVQKVSQTISISTDSLKNWFPDFKLMNEPSSSMELEPEEHSLPPADEKCSYLVHTDVSYRKDAAMRQDSTSQIDVEDSVSQEPKVEDTSEQGPVSKIIFIQNLVRPFTLGQLKDLLKQNGKIVEEYFWIDKIKSKCFVMYETEKEAIKARNALHNTRWPSSNPKILTVDFSNEEELEQHKKGNEIPPKPVIELPVVETPEEIEPRASHSAEEHKRKDRERRKERERPKTQPPVREWDKDKVLQDSPERDHIPKEEKSRSSDKKEKKESKKRPNEDTPAKLLDDLFQKTKNPPCIYWLPLTEEQAKQKEEAKNLRKLEREKRNQQLRDQEEAERRNKRARSSRRSREKENRKSSTRSRSPVSRRR